VKFYKLDKDKSNIEMINLFKDIQNSVLFAKKLRESSYMMIFFDTNIRYINEVELVDFSKK